MISYQRSRFSEPPPRHQLGTGMPPVELWGVATRDLSKPRVHKRTEAAKARRQAKRAAKAAGMTLKAYLRQRAAA